MTAMTLQSLSLRGHTKISSSNTRRSNTAQAIQCRPGDAFTPQLALASSSRASFPLSVAERGVPYVIINRGATDHDGLELVTLRLEGDVGVVFAPAVVEALKED